MSVYEADYAVLPPLIPPFRHAIVEEGFHRGAHPSLRNMRFMRRLKLKTIISLLPDPTEPSRDLVEFCTAEHIRHICHGVEIYDDGFSHSHALVATILGQITDRGNHPVFLHCLDGRQNTGIVVMCLRRMQNWNLEAILDEFRRYTKSNESTYEEKQFVQSFNFKMVNVPHNVPLWLLLSSGQEKPSHTASDAAGDVLHMEHSASEVEEDFEGTRQTLLPKALQNDCSGHTWRISDRIAARRARATAEISTQLAALNVDGVEHGGKHADPPVKYR